MQGEGIHHVDEERLYFGGRKKGSRREIPRLAFRKGESEKEGETK